jgi:hypothetical protein
MPKKKDKMCQQVLIFSGEREYGDSVEKSFWGQVRWLTSVIPATQEAEMGEDCGLRPDQAQSPQRNAPISKTSNRQKKALIFHTPPPKRPLVRRLMWL